MAGQGLPYRDYLMKYLKDQENALSYLNECFRDDGEGDHEQHVCRAIRDVIRARGFARVSADANVGRESLYKSFADHADPRMSTLLKVLRSLGFAITLAQEAPKSASASPVKRSGKPVREPARPARQVTARRRKPAVVG